MSTMEEKTYWFVYDHYTICGPKLEQAVITWAKLQYLHHLIADDQLPYVVKKIQDMQDELWEQNKRLKKVEVKASEATSWTYDSDHRTIFIGQQTLRLRRVKGTIG